ncbi:hypothetical protein BRIN106911_14550 [Brevibacillus invocatus]
MEKTLTRKHMSLGEKCVYVCVRVFSFFLCRSLVLNECVDCIVDPNNREGSEK